MLECAACGARLAAQARFCDQCGTPVETAAAPEPAAQSRKIVTMLFADLAGSTALGERIDPEAVRTVMDRYYDTIRRVVAGHDGRVVKFIGDGAMAVFGVPETREDDARRALHASIALHDAFDDFATGVEREIGVSMSLRIGVNTGEVIVSAGDDDVVGDAVNVAARLEHAATPGSVLVGEDTWRLARGYASFEAVAPLTLAGKADPVHAYRLLAVADTAPEPRTEFVGRVHELDELRAAFGEVARTGRARLAVVLGSPGVGKTRLGTELQRVLSDRANVVFTRCTQGGAATLAPVIDLLHAAIESEATDDAAVTRAVAALVPEQEADRDRIVASVAGLLGAGASGTPEETLWAVRRLLEVAARATPVVVMIDDLQWGEPMLLDLVEHVAEWARAPVLLVALARPELRDVRGSLVDAGRRTVVSLEGLDRECTEQLACDLLASDAVPAPLLDRLTEYTSGNPLFVRELLRMLVDDETLAVVDGAWRLTVAPGAIEVPPTIQSLLAARLDRLPADEQLLLERASIAGKEFPLGALRELLPLASGAAIDALLESLRRKELVEPDGSYWIDEAVFRFHHVLIRDAAYRRVLRQTRAELHERLARWMAEKLGSRVTEYEESVGFHLEQAFAQRRELGALDGHARAVGREAAERLGRAAERALDREDLPAAAALASRALTCASPADTGRADALLVHCEALLSMGEAAAAADSVRELERLAAGDDRLAAWSTCFASQLANLTDPSRLRATEARVAAVAQQFGALGDASGAAKAHAVHAETLARLGRYADVEATLDLALTYARAANHRRLITAALAGLPIAAVWGPHSVPRAGGRCLDVVRLLRITAASPAVEATSQRCQAVLEAFRGRPDAGRRLIAAARATLEELGLAHALHETELYAGIVELVDGGLDDAQRHLQNAYTGLRALGAGADAARAAALLGRCCLQRGDVETAEVSAYDAELLAGDDLQSGIAWRGVRAEILASRGQHVEALALAEEAVAMAAGTDAVVHHADACAALAAVHRAAGNADAAERAATTASELYARKGASALNHDARAEAFGVPEARPLPRTELGNAATAAYVRLQDVFARRAWDEVATCVAADFVNEDRRPALRAVSDARRSGATMRALAEEGTVTLPFTALAIRGDRLALGAMSAPRAAGEASFDSQPLTVIGANADGLLSFAIEFDTDDVDGAIAELDARYIADEGAPWAEILRMTTVLNAAYNARDWDTMHSIYAADLRSVDHRLGGWGTLESLDALLQNLKTLITMVADASMVMRQVVATSEDAILFTVRVEGHDAVSSTVELSFQMLHRVRDGRVVEMETYPLDALDNALASFHGTSADARVNAATRAMYRMGERFAQRDWDGLAALFVPDYVGEHRRNDTRHDRFGTARDLRVAYDLGARTLRYTPLAERGERLALGRVFVRGRQDGGDRDPFDLENLSVSEVGTDGRFVSGVVFAPDDLDAAFAELDARARNDDLGRVLSNASTEVTEVLRRRFAAGDWDALTAMFAANFVGELRRFRDQFDDAVAVMRIARESDASRLTFVPIAVRGDRFSLSRGWIAHDPDALEPFSIELLALQEIDADRRIAAAVTFDIDDLDAAIAELDARYLAAADTAHADVARLVFDLAHAYNSRDWDLYRSMFDDNAVAVDHRPAGWGRVVGSEGVVANINAMIELVPDMHCTCAALIGTAPDTTLTLLRFTGTSPEGTAVEFSMYNLIKHRGGRVALMEMYPESDASSARERFEALTAATPTELEPNRAFEVIIEMTGTAARADVEGFGTWFAPGYRSDDRRAGVRPESLDISDLVGPAIQEATRSTASLIGTRGSRLCLYRTVTTGTTREGFAWEFDVIAIAGINEHDLIEGGAIFDPYDVDAAIEDLDARYGQTLEPARRAVWEPLAGWMAAIRAHDWDGAAALAPDLVLEDHRLAGFGTLESREVSMLSRAYTEVTPGDIDPCFAAVEAITESGAIVMLWHTETELRERETPLWAVLAVDAGHVSRLEMFSMEQHGEALDRLDALARSANPIPENRAVRATRDMSARMRAGDWDDIAELWEADAVFEDRRRGVGHVLVGRDAMQQQMHVVRDISGLGLEFVPVATRGETLVLSRVRALLGDGFETELLAVDAVTDEGRAVRQVLFDVDDLEAAYAELDRLHAEGF
jgi:class 3 adenylate cyclase